MEPPASQHQKAELTFVIALGAVGYLFKYNPINDILSDDPFFILKYSQSFAYVCSIHNRETIKFLRSLYGTKYYIHYKLEYVFEIRFSRRYSV